MSSSESVRPTRTSALAAAATALTVGALLLQRVEVPRFLLVMAFGGGFCLAFCLYLVERPPGGVRSVVVSVLTVPVAVGLVGGLVGLLLVFVGRQFPVPTDADISVALLRIGGSLGAVVGCTFVVFGLVLGYRNVLAAKPLSRYTKFAAVTATVPLVTGLVASVRVALAGNRRATESPFGRLVDQFGSVLLSPGPVHLHLGSFLFVLTVTGGALLVFLRSAPVAELLELDDRLAAVRRLERLRWWLYVAVTASSLLMIGAVVLEVLFSPGQLRTLLGPALFETVQLVTTAGWLRFLLLGVTVGALGWLALQSLFDLSARRPEVDGRAWLGPLAAGVGLTAFAWFAADSLLERTLEETTTRLPDALAAMFQDAVLPVVDVYGESTVVVLLAGLVLGVAAWLSLALWMAVRVEYLSNEAAGFSVAAAGLLLGAVSVTTTDPPSWLVFVGIAAALSVWDLGRFGARLGREVGPSGARSVELVHAVATLFVGALAVTGAMLLESLAAGSSFRPSPELTLAIVALVAGLVAFSLAVRDSIPFR